MIIMDRTRRLRMNATLRDMVRENHVRVDELIYPVFVTEENDVIQEVPSMPGICQYSLDHVLEEIGRAVEVGIKGILLFGIPVHKDEVGSEAYDEEGVVCRAIRLIKDAYPSCHSVQLYLPPLLHKQLTPLQEAAVSHHLI